MYENLMITTTINDLIEKARSRVDYDKNDEVLVM
jgi:hypothetical protein